MKRVDQRFPPRTKNEFDVRVGRVLRRVRLAKELTQADVAKALHVAQQTVGHWEQAHGKIPLFYFCQLKILMPDLLFTEVLAIWRDVEDSKHSGKDIK